MAPEGDQGTERLALAARRGLGWLRSGAAIALGVALTALLMHYTVDPVQATIVHAAFGQGNQAMTAGDWGYLAVLTARRYAPFLVGALVAGRAAAADRAMHALIALNVAIVLWLLGTI